MKKQHPSGRPIRDHIVKSAPRPVGTSTGFWNERLNMPTRHDLPGGFGFRLPPEPEDSMWLETRAKR